MTHKEFVERYGKCKFFDYLPDDWGYTVDNDWIKIWHETECLVITRHENGLKDFLQLVFEFE